MSNVLCPIVARYSLFFTLALFDSSTLALSKQPREDALNMVQRAQAQFQAHHRHRHATKLRALIRNVSTASSSSTSSSSSSSTYSSSHQSQSSASTAPSSTSSTVLLSSSPKDVEALSTETVTQSNVTSSQPPPQVKGTPTTSTSSPTSLAPIPSSSTLHLSSSSASSSPTTHPAQKGSPKKTRARRASKPSAAITTLLSISITIILLSLLQSRSRYQLVRQKSIVTQGSHNDRRSHRRRRHQNQQQTKQQAPKQHRLVSTENPSSPLTQLCEHSCKGDSATCVPDSVHKVKNTSTSIKATAPANCSLSSSSSTLFVFTSTTTVAPTTTTTMATLAHSISTLSPTSSKQLRNELVTAWLQQQIIDPTIDCNCDYHLDTNQIEDYPVSDYLVSDQQCLHPGTIPSYNSYHHLLLQANHSTAPTSRATFVQEHGHRRCQSLMNPSTSLATPTQTTTYEEQLQQQLEWHGQNDQHPHTTATIATTVIPQYPEHLGHPLIEEHTPYWPPQRTAEELAWERHNYYLRLQAEEEELIERLQSDRKQSRGHRTQNKTLNHLWQPRPDASSVARAGSLNRLSGPSLLSAETSRVLGLCRSSTLSAVKKIGFAKKDTISRSSRSTSPLPVSNNTNTTKSIIDDSILTRGLAIHSYERITTTASHMTAATASSSTFFSFSPKSSTPSTMGASSPLPKNLLKDHLGPSLKSLARRCSTRFGRSSRCNSYAGPSGEAVVEYPHGRRSLGSHPSQHKQRGHLYDFKQLPTGPTGGSTDISTPSRPQEDRYRRSMSNERVPVHRTVTLFRSESTRAPSSTSMVKRHDDYPTPITTVLDLPYRPHPNSLRFANGRGLDFSNTPNLTSVSSSPSHSNRSSIDFKRNAMSLSSLPSVVEDKEMVPMITTSLVDNLESPSAVFVSSLIPTSVLDFEEHESMRQQIVAILSLDRNDMRRRPSSKPRSRSTTPRIPQDHSSSQQEDQKQQQQPQQQLELECLSPLAVEAQEVLPEDPKTIQAQEVAAELADPCEHIAFMLVPKTQYEFQPLIAH